MCAPGIGVAFVVGYSTVAFYFKDIGKILVSDGSQVGLVDYLRPDARTAAVIGASLAAGAIGAGCTIGLRRLAGDEIDDAFNDVVQLVRPRIPAFAASAFNATGEFLKKGTTTINDGAKAALVIPSTYQIITDTQKNTIVSVVEEAIFRLPQAVVSKLLEDVLKSLNVSPVWATTFSVVLSSSLFASSHTPAGANWSIPKWKDLFVAGVIFGVVMHFFKLKGAIAAHMAYNTVMDLV